MLNLITRVDILADLHTHTIFSKHAYSTLKENVTEAYEKGIKYLAVTDHYFVQNDYVENKNDLARLMYVHEVKPRNSVVIIPGAEFNLMQPFSPLLNMSKLYKNVLWRPVGVHSWYMKVEECRAEDFYTGFKQLFDDNAMYVKPTAFCHIERKFNKCKDPENAEAVLYKIVDLAIDRGIYLELNENSIRRGLYNGNIDRMKQWVPYAVRKGARFCLGTDAHYAEAVGDFTNIIELVNDMGIEKSRILNCNEQELFKFVK